MTKIFILSADVESPEEENCITTLLIDEGYDVWHYMEKLWLLHIHSSEINSFSLRDKIASKVRRPMFIVEVTAIESMAGILPQAAGRWLDRYWYKENETGFGK